jgi:hypothetical protein
MDAKKINAEMTEAKSNDGGNRVLLIDLENCPSQINQLLDNLEQYSHVIVCYAQSGANTVHILLSTVSLQKNQLCLIV